MLDTNVIFRKIKKRQNQSVAIELSDGSKAPSDSQSKMTDQVLRKCILDLLKLTKLHSVKLRRRCNEQWCRELHDLSGNSLVRRLRFIVWWSPVRTIAKAYKRGMLNGQRVLNCVFDELRLRGVEEAAFFRGIAEEIKGKFKFL